MTNDCIKLPVMVVEDCQSSMSLVDMLVAHQEFKHLVLMADNQKALSYLDECEVAAIIIDLDLPANSGLDLLKQVTSSKPHIPIVTVTGANQVDAAVECMKLGAFDYLTKPICIDRLTHSVRDALDFRCLKEVANLLRDTPCIQGSGATPEASNESAPVPFTLPTDVPDRLRKAVDYMDLNLSKPLSLENIARKACLSKFHFCREFKKYIGISPIQFMMHRRICQATILLQSRELSISSVAVRSGFNDQSEFTKWFKKATGFTPSWYRKSFGSR
jgi:AraC family transcriptional regulator